jgi:hypothetical protein
MQLYPGGGGYEKIVPLFYSCKAHNCAPLVQIASLFSTAYEFLFREVLSFDIHTNCPGVGGYEQVSEPSAVDCRPCLPVLHSHTFAPFYSRIWTWPWAAKSFKAHSYEKCARKSFRAHSYEIRGLEVPSNHTVTKKGVGYYSRPTVAMPGAARHSQLATRHFLHGLAPGESFAA